MNIKLLKHTHGFSLIEALLAISVLSVMILIIFSVTNNWADNNRDIKAAQNMIELHSAAERYAELNFNTLTQTGGTLANIDDVQEITVNDLVALNLLPAGYNSTNVNGQNMRIFLRNASSITTYGTALDVLILNDGPIIKNNRLIRTATLGGSRLGMSSALNISATCCVGNIQNLSGIWSLPLSAFSSPATTYTQAPTITGGYLAAYSRIVNENNIHNDHLMKTNTGVFNEPNRMKTNLDMNQYDLINVSSIVADSLEVSGNATFEPFANSAFTSSYILAVNDNFTSDSMDITFGTNENKGYLNIDNKFTVDNDLDVRLNNITKGGIVNTENLNMDDLSIDGQIITENANIKDLIIQSKSAGGNGGNMNTQNIKFARDLEANSMQIEKTGDLNKIHTESAIVGYILVDKGGAGLIDGELKVEKDMIVKKNVTTNNLHVFGNASLGKTECKVPGCK